MAVKLTGWKIDIVSAEEKQGVVDADAGKLKVHELAKQLGLKSKEIVDKLTTLGYEVRAANSVVPPEAVAKLRKL